MRETKSLAWLLPLLLGCGGQAEDESANLPGTDASVLDVALDTAPDVTLVPANVCETVTRNPGESDDDVRHRCAYAGGRCYWLSGNFDGCNVPAERLPQEGCYLITPWALCKAAIDCPAGRTCKTFASVDPFYSGAATCYPGMVRNYCWPPPNTFP
jgi:hypothetical protein